MSQTDIWKAVPCKIWRGSLSPGGYGKTTLNGVCMNASRREYILHHGDVPKGYVVMHKCHNRACYEIKHLELGTQSENMLDAGALGRLSRDVRGEKNSMSRLTEVDVTNIRELYANGNTTQTSIAQSYGVSSQLISQIVRRKKWAHV